MGGASFLAAGAQAVGAMILFAGKAAISSAVIGGVVGGLISAVTGQNVLTGMLNGTVQGYVNGFVLSCALYSVASTFKMVVAVVDAHNRAKTVDLYRAVGVREYESINANKVFFEGGKDSLDAKQFAFTEAEALAYARTDLSKVAIAKVTVPQKIISKFHFSRTIDPFIFSNGVLTVQNEMLELLNKSIINLIFL